MARLRRRNDKPKEFKEVVLEVKRVMRVVKGGRRLRFRALVAIGNGKGKIGIGLGKAGEVAEAIRKANNQARKELLLVPITKAGTIPHEIHIKVNASRLFLRPATAGTGIIAGGAVRQILELTGVRDILSKTHGSLNKANIAQATMVALAGLQGEYEFVPTETFSKRSEAKLAEARSNKRRQTQPDRGGKTGKSVPRLAANAAETAKVAETVNAVEPAKVAGVEATATASVAAVLDKES